MTSSDLHTQQRVIFRTRPVLVAHPTELETAGQFVRTWMAGLPVVAVTQPSGRSAAFVGICGHQGAMLVEARAGTIASLSCPRHGWTYDLNGQVSCQRPAAQSDRPLVSAHLCRTAGLVWGTLDEPIRPEWLEPITPNIAKHVGRCDRLESTCEFGISGSWERVKGNITRALAGWVARPEALGSPDIPSLRGIVAGAHVIWTTLKDSRDALELLEVFPNTVVARREYAAVIVTCVPMAATFTSVQIRILRASSGDTRPDNGERLVRRLRQAASSGDRNGLSLGYEDGLSASILREVMSKHD